MVLLAPTPRRQVTKELLLLREPILCAGWRMSVPGTLSETSECTLHIQWYRWWSSSTVLVFRNMRNK